MEQFLNDITVWAAAYDWLRIVLTFLLMVGVPLFVAIVMLFGSEKLIAALRAVYQQIRPQFDQVTDPLVLAIAARTGLTADQVVQFLTSADGLLLTANGVLALDRPVPASKMVVDVKATRGPVTGESMWERYQAYKAACDASGTGSLSYEDWLRWVTSPEADEPRSPGSEAVR